MNNINREHSRTIVSDKPWNWYYDRLPKRLRKALAESDHNWSDMQVYRLWKGNKGYTKRTIAEVLEILRKSDESKAYDWMTS